MLLTLLSYCSTTKVVSHTIPATGSRFFHFVSISIISLILFISPLKNLYAGNTLIEDIWQPIDNSLLQRNLIFKGNSK